MNNIRNKIAHCLLLYTIFLCPHLLANDEHRIATVPNKYEWIIEIQANEANELTGTSTSLHNADLSSADLSGQAQERALKRVSVSKQGQVYREVKEFSDGSQEENWFFPGIILAYDSEKKTISMTEIDLLSTMGEDYYTSEFPQLRWVSKDNFVRRDIYNDRPVFVYQTDYNPPSEEEIKIANIFADSTGAEFNKEEFLRNHKLMAGDELTAIIDAQSRLPIIFSNQSNSYRFTFRPLTSDLVVPSRVQKAMSAIIKEKNYRSIAPPAP